MKSKSLIISLTVAAFLSSYVPTGSHQLEIGREAPALTFSSTSSKAFDELKGNNILLNFWSATDAASRIRNRELSEYAETSDSKKLRIVSVCIDEDLSLGMEIARIDGISDKVISLSRKDLGDDILDDYQTEKGCRSFVIDSYGNLKAISPEIEDMEGYLS